MGHWCSAGGQRDNWKGWPFRVLFRRGWRFASLLFFRKRFRKAHPADRPSNGAFRNRQCIAFRHLCAIDACFQIYCHLDLWNETLRSAYEKLSVLSKRSLVITTQGILVWVGVGGIGFAPLSACFAQLKLGRILGSISGPKRRVIAGRHRDKWLDVPRGVARNLTTDSAGGFSASSLVPSTYTVKVEFKGSRPSIVKR